jgi:hypothetical protein
MEVKLRSKQMPISKKLHPYKILVYLIWGQYHGRTVIRPGRIKIRSSSICRALRIEAKMFRVYLKELERMNLVCDLVLVRGAAYLTIKEPTLWKSI